MAATIVPPPNDHAAPRPTAVACANCGSAMIDVFCARCGEQQPSHRDLSMRAVAHEAVQEFAGVDGKIPRTLWALITRPGLLTREFIDGRRGRYSKPLSLFLALNLVFFVVQPYTGLLRYSLDDYIGTADDANDARPALMVQAKLAKTGESREAYEPRFNRALDDQKKSMILFSVPVLAVVMLVLFAGSRRYFVEHLVFAVHAYAFFLVVLAIGVALFFYTLGGWLSIAELLGVPTRRLFELMTGEVPTAAAILAPMVVYLTVAIRRAYGSSTRLAFGRALILSFVQMYLILLFRSALFYPAFFAT
jgi:hypothetical protein